MPAEDRVDPTRLDASTLSAALLDSTLLEAVAVRLTRAGVDALEASHDLLAHYPDTGDASTQRVVDTLIDQAAEALGALADSLDQASGELVAGAARAATPPTGKSSPAKGARRRGPFV